MSLSTYLKYMQEGAEMTVKLCEIGSLAVPWHFPLLSLSQKGHHEICEIN